MSLHSSGFDSEPAWSSASRHDPSALGRSCFLHSPSSRLQSLRAKDAPHSWSNSILAPCCFTSLQLKDGGSVHTSFSESTCTNCRLRSQEITFSKSLSEVRLKQYFQGAKYVHTVNSGRSPRSVIGYVIRRLDTVHFICHVCAKSRSPHRCATDEAPNCRALRSWETHSTAGHRAG